MDREAFLLAWDMIEKVKKNTGSSPKVRVICMHAEYEVESLSRIHQTFVGFLCSAKNNLKLVVLVDIHSVQAIEMYSAKAQLEGVIGILSERKPRSENPQKGTATQSDT